MKYKPLPRKGDVDAEIALFQAMYALDAAATVAEETQDVKGLLRVTQMWVNVSEALDAYAKAAGPPMNLEHEAHSKIEVGFQRAEILADREEEDARDDED